MQGAERGNNTLLDNWEVAALARQMERDVNGYREVDRQKNFLAVFVVPSLSRPLDNVRSAPCYVSIGPCHWGSAQLCLKNQKLLYLKTLLILSERTTTRHLVRLVSEMKHYILACYGLDGPQRRELVERLIYDGCYLIFHYGLVRNQPGERQGTASSSSHQPSERAPSTEQRGTQAELRVDQPGWWPRLPNLQLLRITGRGSSSGSSELATVQNHSIAGSRSSQAPIQLTNEHAQTNFHDEAEHKAAFVRDLWYLVENQIPFFVVEGINKKLFRGVNEEEIRAEFIKHARGILERKKFYVSREVSSPESSFEFFHLLHLLHILIIKPMIPESENTNTSPSSLHPLVQGTQRGPWRRATEYVSHCNVRFVGQELDRTKGPHSVLDVCIEGGKVKLPHLHIDDHTWTILHNLVALEKTNPSLGSYVTAYCFFMSQLACTAEDVQLLQKCKVIHPYVCGHKLVAAGFAELSSLIVLDVQDNGRNYLTPIWLELEKRYTSSWHKFWSWFRLTYWNFRSLPVVIAVIVGFVLLVAGLLSALFQVLSYYHQGGAGASQRGHN